MLAHGSLVPHLHDTDVIAFAALWVILWVVWTTVRAIRKGK